MSPALVIFLAYLLGSIPFGYLLVRLVGGGDVRASGSGGTGATNVTRRAGKGAGVLTLVLDALKGALAVVGARWLLTTLPPTWGSNWWVVSAAFAAIVGHCFPVWLRFRGGKGVATGLGVFLALVPLAVAIVGVVFLLVVWRTRYVSLGSITAAALMPLCVWLLARIGVPTTQSAPLVAVALAGGALIIFMHRANISRLLNGTENRLN
ncbi:MAG TPA: glycerol-3-phosphate 1-O-acyltransferase PlsY [Pyrinomonadaceae bacterium]|jgi:glycerol-3-phosphate acyltransferase PlsY